MSQLSSLARPLSLHVTNPHHHCQIPHHWLPFSYRNAERERDGRKKAECIYYLLVLGLMRLCPAGLIGLFVLPLLEDIPLKSVDEGGT